MKNKLIVGALSSLLLLGGAIAVDASKNDTKVEDSIHQEDKKIGTNLAGKKVEINTDHDQTVIRVKPDDSNSADDTKADDGAHQNRHSGDDDTKADDGAHQNRHSGDDDTKADDGAHQNRHNGDDDTKTDDGTHQNRHSGDDDMKADDGAHQNRHSSDDDK
jgi:hypothetical protein